MKVAVVVQRYGAEINGGAEQHARYVAEHLAPHAQIEVLTTCARDYITWKNELPEGVEQIHGVPVRRFPVARERDPVEFATWSDRVFETPHSLRDELAWLDAEGPTSPSLIRYITEHEREYDFFIFFSFRYPHSFYGTRAVTAKALLVPTAERDGALGLAVFGPIFRGVRALMYNSYEERATIHGVSKNQDVPGVVVGIGSEIPPASNAGRFRQKFGLRDRFAIYVGRIDRNKGCAELFEFFEHYSAGLVDGMHLVLIGAPIIPIPEHPRIHHLGFVEDQDKFDAIAASELLIMPSYLESLSMVALEAWALGKPVLANAKCEVLQGQCLRSNAGLFYENYREFAETLRVIDTNPNLQAALGRNGRSFFERHYSWPVIEKKYLDMLERLGQEPATQTMEPLPGWFARRRRSLPPANSVVQQLPSGPVREATEAARPTADRPAEAPPPRPQLPRSPSPVRERPGSGATGPPSPQRPDGGDHRPDPRPARPDTPQGPPSPARDKSSFGGTGRPQRPDGRDRPDHRGGRDQKGRGNRRGRPDARGRRSGGGR